jgi:hypothetical protein
MPTVEQSLHMATVSNEVAEAYADCWDYHPPQGVMLGPDWDAVSKRRNLDFLASRWLPRDDAKWVMEQWVKDYNEFSPEVIDKFPAEAEIRIAREGSVCLYVKLPYGCKKKLPCAKRVAADECDEMLLLSSPCVRYWWD